MKPSMERKSVEIRRLADCTFRQAVELWNLGFAGYYSDMTLTLDQFVAKLASESIRPELSVAAFIGSEPAGFVLVAVKEVEGVNLAWNGGTGVHPAHRGKGLAKLLMREAIAAMKEGGAETAFLEVVQKNAGAIAAYENAGFRVCDELIGMKRIGALNGVSSVHPFATEAYSTARAKPQEMTKLPFFRHETAWTSAWFHLKDAEGIVVLDREGVIVAYALTRRTYGENGKLLGTTLFQCAAEPSRPDRKELLGTVLAEAFGPPDEACQRSVSNLSISDPAVIEWLEAAGFETVYTQYLMIAKL
ncbi:GNAT family N-acetyltransferase [Paenibacillus allorhizosphaerae]|uniref:N-acetyltransferase domain-containing protein n=1 Tax=Paenibacillus allorhizosphaerae TaxID=2849866 RepID=A0ABM8VRC3_9BACL|nr:GNAT family N-acetyltransferase [Paenibacillus allorhizosphaerae]CAG7655111.1 hypothetical protein PAECIP111802_06017 [Paenibacillus allorhizosphaerae]